MAVSFQIAVGIQLDRYPVAVAGEVGLESAAFLTRVEGERQAVRALTELRPIRRERPLTEGENRDLDSGAVGGADSENLPPQYLWQPRQVS